MPNQLQSVFLLSSGATFCALYLIVHTVFPGVIPRLDFGLLFSGEPSKMGFDELVKVNTWRDLLAGEKLLALLVMSVTPWILVSLFGNKSTSLACFPQGRFVDVSCREETSPRSKGVQGVPAG